MKWSPLAIGSLVSTALLGAAIAQSDFTPPATDASTYSSNPGSTTANTGLTAPRTGIYNAVTALNAAADITVDVYIQRPTLINGQQFFSAWGDNTLRDGAFSFNTAGYDWFGSATGTDVPTLLRAGIAKGGAWGAGLMLSLAKESYDTPAGDTKTVLQGDGFGLFGNLDIGNSDVYGRFGVFTDFDDVAPEPDNYSDQGDTETDNTLFAFTVGWKKGAAGQGTHALNAELQVEYGSTDSPTLDATRTEFDLLLFHGFVLKETPGYDVFLGSNSQLVMDMGDNKTAKTGPSRYGLFVSPNIAFQKNLMWSFEGFAGADVTLGWEMYNDAAGALPGRTAPGAATGSNTFFTSRTGANLGLRWVKDNLAIEGSLADTFLSSGPNFIGGGTPGFLSRVGLSLAI